jgi:glutamate---cysteine ligase / carboxylate-amine ligase
MLDHAFNGPSFTVGIEEELMILEGDSYALAQAIEPILSAVPAEFEGQVKPEFLQCVLEIATGVHASVPEAGEELRNLRRTVIDVAEGCGLLIGAAGTHPFARWEDQQIVERERYEALAEDLGFILRQFVIFGTHVHVAIEGADRAIYVADGMRRHLPVLLALSTNSPFHRGYPTGMHSSRTPVFRALPRSGIPPHFGGWAAYAERIDLMKRLGSIEDYTYIWWDVRPHPKLGTVETRIFDQQTRVEHTEALAALVQSLCHRLSGCFDAGQPIEEFPAELIDDAKIRAALRGMDGKLVDFEEARLAPSTDLAARLIDDVSGSAAELGCEAQLEGIQDVIKKGTGAHRQLEMFERHPDLDELMREVVERTRV